MNEPFIKAEIKVEKALIMFKVESQIGRLAKDYTLGSFLVRSSAVPQIGGEVLYIRGTGKEKSTTYLCNSHKEAVAHAHRIRESLLHLNFLHAAGMIEYTPY